MIVKHYTPSPKLASIVAYYWTLESNREEESNGIYRLIPDGYIDWVFQIQAPWGFHYDAVSDSDSRSPGHFFSHISQYMAVKLPVKALSLIGVKFHPWAARQAWQLKMNELTDRAISFSDAGPGFLRELTVRLPKLKNSHERIKLIETTLVSHLKNYRKSDLQQVVQQLMLQPNRTAVENFGNSQRRLEQRFQDEIGISPKLLQRIFRLNRALQLMIDVPEERLTDIAYSCGFFDQSHFIRDFKLFTGLKPSHFRKAVKPSGDFFNLRVG